jgi:uncharacterized membrane protein YedE/YeeE/rhodanese-related sulfurtransferase
MGPLFPDIVSPGLNLIAALLIGIAFGAILEQAGFSSARKLVGLFYGTDFTVLRVFFTAGIVAMVGLMLFDRFALIDLNLIYINPMYLWSALLGGAIMGLGFVIGGYCPGTSICAVAIGKTDAMIFVVGVFLGVLFFMETFTWFEPLYTGANYGWPKLYESLALPREWVAFTIISIAVTAFIGVRFWERRNNPRPPLASSGKETRQIAVLGIILAVATLFLPGRQEAFRKRINDDAYVRNYPLATISGEELALSVMHPEVSAKLQIFDFRPPAEFDDLALPGSRNYSFTGFFSRDATRRMQVLHRDNIFVANSEWEARKMAVIASEMGVQRIRVLAGGLNAFRRDILAYDDSTRALLTADQRRFRRHARDVLPAMLAAQKQPPQKEKKTQRVVGGC